MENKIIQIKGITRNTDDGICPDGECMELINARLKNGSIEPIGKPILIKETKNTYKNIFYHTLAKRYIGITSDGKMYEMPEDFSSETLMSGDVKAKSIGFIGNTVSVITDEGIIYFLFRNGNYIYLGDLPDLPKMTIKKSLKLALEEVNEIGSVESEVGLGNYLKVINKANKDGYYCYSAAFCAAFRLFDGSCTKSTEIKLVYLTEDDSGVFYYNDEEFIFYGGTSATSFKQINNQAILLCFKPVFEFEEYDLSLWSDIIIGIDIYSTDNFRNQLETGSSPSVVIIDKESESPFERASSINIMYNIGSLKIGETSFTATNIDVSVDNLATMQAMVDSFSLNHKIYSEKAYVYNNRLHLYQIKKNLFNGYKIVQGDETYDFNIYTYIHASDGDKIVVRKEKGAYIPSFIMYPDSRAYKIVINCTNTNKWFSVFLKKSDYFDFSYYCKEIIKDGLIGKVNTGRFEDIKIEDFGSEQYYVAETDSLDYSRQNVMYVSNLNNPFFFPADQVYMFNTSIIGILSNVIAMSQGQFGQFPLYVFTKDGVYAMSVGNGNIAYASQTPVTRDVCNNPDSICGLDKMVAFSTDKGLMVIDGNITTLISEKMYGFLPSCTISSPIIPKILNVASLGDCLSGVVFPDYMEQCKVGYNYGENEIVVSNNNYDYSYAYSMKTGEWHKISQKVESFVNSYPYTWALNGNQILDLNNNHRSISKIAVITRPVKLGSLKHKRILQTALRGIVKRSLSDLYLRGEPVMFRGENVDIFSDVGMYILGSNDAEHFELISKKERMEDIRDLVTKMNKSKPYKYFMICLVGGVRTDVSINYIEMVIDESFTNRLR